MPMQGSFDAQQFAPKQVGSAHPTGKKFPFQITNTSIVPTKDGNGGMFVVEFTTPAGTIDMRYNLWNQSEKAVQIAQGQLSALCHATGIFRVDFPNDGAALKGGRGQIDVDDQIDKETGKPNGYTQVTKVYDASGNEPGKGAAQPQVQPQQNNWQQPQPNNAAPMTQQPNGGGWGAQQPTNPAPQQPQGWTQQPPQSADAKPPWAK